MEKALRMPFICVHTPNKESKPDLALGWSQASLLYLTHNLFLLPTATPTFSQL